MQYIKDLIEELEAIRSKYGNLPLIYSGDDEGNSFNNIFYSASVGNFEDGEFIPEGNFTEYEMEESDINAVCVN